MNFEQYLSGMIQICVPAQRTEEVLQQLTENGVQIYRVKRQKENLYFLLLLEDFFMVQHLLREQHCMFHVEQRMGLPFLISRIKRQKGLWIGSCLGFTILYLLLSFLWGYQVSGNVQYSDAHFIALVQEYGMIPGAKMDQFDYDMLGKQILLDHPEFTWIQLRPVGTTLYIQVKERFSDSVEPQQKTSIIADADGRITELLVFRGTPLVKRGDWVTKGQILVGGWDYSDRKQDTSGVFVPVGEPYAVQAKAVIYGEQERRMIASCALKEQVLQFTGHAERQVALEWNGYHLVLCGPKESPYVYSSIHTEQHSLWQWQQFCFPISVKTTIFQEKELQCRTHTREDAYQIAVERARKRLQEQLPNKSRLLHESAGLYRAGQSQIVQAEVVWLVEENMAQNLPKTLPKAEEIDIQEKTE